MLNYDNNGRLDEALKENTVRRFESGATRSGGVKLEYTRFFDARVNKRVAEYMHKHRTQADGSVREPDNWKKGIDRGSYVASLARHEKDMELWEQGYPEEMTETIEDSLCALMFNAHGLLYEILKEQPNG